MIIRHATIEDRERWDDFVKENDTGGFTQSWEWGDFLNTQNEKIWRLIVEDDPPSSRRLAGLRRGTCLAVMFLFKSVAKMGQSILYAPRGPVVNDQIPMTNDQSMTNDQCWRLIVEEVDKIAKEEGAMAFQVDPFSEDKSWCGIFDELGFVKCERDILPRHTLMLDLRGDEENLLKQMHEKTRYNIGVAKKHGVEIVADNLMFKEFHELLKKTEARQKVKFYGQNYFKELLKVPFAKLYVAKLDGKIIAANIIICWDNTATYLFGASDHDFRNVMAPYLLQWQAIKDAKRDWFWFYDFWGVAPESSTGKLENWAGFTKFKMGFSPNAEIVEYVGTYEKIYQPIQLGIYRFLQKMFK
ncbi:peptidoglycan bridge formation glycyltransferase FemA/FemB family protein [Candidatus Falkowbacteria bacterium]|nr:peptidoglycan bridge formation glycyltransferase FemA/FemB family protein [Candidatus Falkowbacteria bacterium]